MYRASVAQWKAEQVARRPKLAKLVANPRLHHDVEDRLNAWFMMLVAVRLLALDRHRSRLATNLIEVTENRSPAGRLNRLLTGCASTSRITKPCVSVTKPVTKPLPGPLHSGSWCSQARAGALPAHRAGIARTLRQGTGQGMGTRQRGCDDLRSTRRGGRSHRSRTLGG